MNLFNIILRLKGYPVAEARKQLRSILSASRDVETYWEEKKWHILRYMAGSNSFYRNILGNVPDSWNNVPEIHKSDYQGDLSAHLTNGYHPRNIYRANTSGSSGDPFFFAKDKMCHALTWLMTQTMYDERVGFGSKEARFYGISLDPATYRAEMRKDWLMNRVRFPVFDLSKQKLESFVDRFKSTSFVYLYGYAGALEAFAEYIESRSELKTLKQICPSIRACISTSEMLTDDARYTMEQAFGVRVYNEYGASETGIIAMEEHSGDLTVNHPLLYLETNENSELLITSLYNRAFPIIRYNIGDIVKLEKVTDSSGICRKVRIRKIEGRTNDTIFLPSGKRAAGLTFYYISRQILENSNVIKQFIIRQTRPDYFEFDMITDRELNTDEVRLLQEQLDIHLEPGLTFGINYVDLIPRPASGKIKHFYSELNET